MHYTSIDQSKKLLELGLSPESADMFYNGIQTLDKRTYYIPEDGHSITVRTRHTITERGIKSNLLLPCWSVGALLKVMPICTTLDHEKNGWWCNVNYDIVDIQNGYKDNSIRGNTPIEVAYNMVVWLLENNYIKKGE